MSTNISAKEPDESRNRDAYLIKGLVRITIFGLIIGGLMFGIADTLDWWMGWAYLSAWFSYVLVALFSVPMDEKFVEERTQVKEDVPTWDKVLTSIFSLLTPLGLVVIAALDRRLGWSPPLALWLQITALIVGSLGYLFSVWASAVNQFYARYVRIQTERGHTVITDGPYRIVRHPGYVGVSIYVIASALALGSLWALILSGLMVVYLIVRTTLEDKLLHEELDGYREYAQKTRYRLLPGIW
jgi:protein-S-isoprenylcysteine O-methyltransferase Ste14